MNVEPVMTYVGCRQTRLPYQTAACVLCCHHVV